MWSVKVKTHIDYPRIHLSVDTCFAIKRWVKPKDWMKAVKAIGNIKNIEASTDNEIDPLFTTASYRSRWTEEVKKFEKELGLKVVSFFSGYATYRTTGLAHWDGSNRNKLVSGYFKPVVDIAEKLGAQVGNTLGAFPSPILEDPRLFRKAEHTVVNALISMTKYAAGKGVSFCYEQMYTPRLGFWTIDACMNYMETVYEACSYPMYITIDTAHQIGQRYYKKPTDADIAGMVHAKDPCGFRLSRAIVDMIKRGCGFDEIQGAIEEYSYLFSSPKDSDVYSWFSELGCYSPIVHLQQTDGIVSGHKPFTAANNAKGIVKPEKVLKAIASSYEKRNDCCKIPKVKDIYLTFEIFFGNTEEDAQVIKDLSESVLYWRKAVPEDGRYLDELI